MNVDKLVALASRSQLSDYQSLCDGIIELLGEDTKGE